MATVAIMIIDLPPREKFVADLLDAVDKVKSRTGCTDKQIERMSGVTPGFLRRLREGFGCTYDMAHRLTDWLRTETLKR